MNQSELTHGQKQGNTHDLRRVQDEKAGLEMTALTYADLLSLDWILEDKIQEWKWLEQSDGEGSMIARGVETLARIRAMVEEYPDELIGKEGR